METSLALGLLIHPQTEWTGGRGSFKKEAYLIHQHVWFTFEY